MPLTFVPIPKFNEESKQVLLLIHLPSCGASMGYGSWEGEPGLLLEATQKTALLSSALGPWGVRRILVMRSLTRAKTQA